METFLRPRRCVQMFLFLYDFANNNGFLVTFYAFVTAVSMCHLTHSFARVSFGMQPMFNLLYTICIFVAGFFFKFQFVCLFIRCRCVSLIRCRRFFDVTFRAIEQISSPRMRSKGEHVTCNFQYSRYISNGTFTFTPYRLTD